MRVHSLHPFGTQTETVLLEAPWLPDDGGGAIQLTKLGLPAARPAMPCANERSSAHRACSQLEKPVRSAQDNSDIVEAVVVEVIEFFGVRLAMTDGKVALLHTSRMTPATLDLGLDVGDTITVRLLGQDVLGLYRAEMPVEQEHMPGEPSASS